MSVQLDESAFDDAMAADPDAALALLADMTRATDAQLRDAGPTAGRTARARRRPARPGAPARDGTNRVRAVRRRRRRPRRRRQQRGDRRGASGVSCGRPRATADPSVGAAAHGTVPARRPQRFDGRQAAGDERGDGGGRGVPCAGRLQRRVVRQGVGGGQVTGRRRTGGGRRRRRAGAAGARDDRPRRRPRRGRAAAGAVHRRSEGGDPAVGLPRRPRPATCWPRRARWTSW